MIGITCLPLGMNQCRICLDVDNSKALISPCRCKGSAGFVHPACLDRWRSVRTSFRCEICHSPFEYPRNTTTLILASCFCFMGLFTYCYLFLFVIRQFVRIVGLDPTYPHQQTLAVVRPYFRPCVLVSPWIQLITHQIKRVDSRAQRMTITGIAIWAVIHCVSLFLPHWILCTASDCLYILLSLVGTHTMFLHVYNTSKYLSPRLMLLLRDFEMQESI